MPTIISPPAITSTPSGGLITDSSYLPIGVSTSVTTTKSHDTTSTDRPINGTHTGGAAGPVETGINAAVLTVVVGAMAWIFAEL